MQGKERKTVRDWRLVHTGREDRPEGRAEKKKKKRGTLWAAWAHALVRGPVTRVDGGRTLKVLGPEKKKE